MKSVRNLKKFKSGQFSEETDSKIREAISSVIEELTASLGEKALSYSSNFSVTVHCGDTRYNVKINENGTSVNEMRHFAFSGWCLSKHIEL